MGTRLSNTSMTTRIRRTLAHALGKQAKYTRLRADRKAPTRSFKEGKPNRMKSPPAEGNYGVIPQGRLMILDFDEHREDSWSIDEQIDFFSEFLEVDLRSSLSVITQSGGVHIYLLFPESVCSDDIETLPKASLRGYNHSFSQMVGTEVKLDADIRTSAVNAYVVGPTSSIKFPSKKTKYNGYIMANESFGFKNFNFEILTISDNGFLKLQEISAMKKRIDVPKDTSRTIDISSMTELIEKGLINSIPTLPDWAEEVHDTNLIHGRPDLTVMGRLRRKLNSEDIQAYHKSRAFVKASLHCCYDDYSIALACSILEINKDSYRGDSIGFPQLMRDIRRFKPSVRYHGGYCHKGRQQSLKHYSNNAGDKDFDVDEFKRKRKEWVEYKRSRKPSGMSNPRVLDVGKISEAIVGDSRKKKPSQQYFDAMNIVNYYLQPLSNVGALRILLAYSDVSKSLNISTSRVRQAMRILRERRILQVAEKQKTGMAASYIVSETFQHEFLTKSLKLTWGKFNSEKADNRIDRSIYFDFSDGTYKTVFVNEIVEPISDFKVWFEKMIKDLPFMETQGAGAATRYLRSEAQAIEEIKELDEEYSNTSGYEDCSLNMNAEKLDDIVIDREMFDELDGIIEGSLPDNYTLWDDDSILDLLSGEIRKLDDYLTDNSS